MTRRHRFAAAAALTAGLLGPTLSGCGSAAGPAASAPPPVTASARAGTGSAAPGISVTASGSSRPTQSPSLPAQPPASAPGRTPRASVSASGTAAGCLSGVVRVRYPGSNNPVHSLCLHIGAQLIVTLVAGPGYLWSPVTSSAPAVLRITAHHPADGGTQLETGVAAAPGTAVLAATDSYTPDPHGPASRLWRLDIRVVS